MDAIRRQQLIRQRSVARGMPSRIQTFIEPGDLKVNEIRVRFDDLQDIFNKYDKAQNELELSDDTDHTGDGELFENHYYQFEAKLNELLHPVVDPPLSSHSSPRSSLPGHSNNSPRSHAISAHIKLPTFECNTCSWLHYRDTFEALSITQPYQMSKYSTTSFLHLKMRSRT